MHKAEYLTQASAQLHYLDKVTLGHKQKKDNININKHKQNTVISPVQSFSHHTGISRAMTI